MTAETPMIGGLYGEVTVVTPWQALTSDFDAHRVSLTAEQWNSPQHLAQFIDRGSLFSLDLSDVHIHLMVSDTPYAERHAMLLLEDDEMLKRADWKEGCIIHEQSESAKLLYWLSVLKTLEGFRKNTKKRSIIVFSENTTRQVTHEGERLPRSIGLIHGHMTEFPLDQIQQYGYVPEIDVDGFQDESGNWGKIHGPFLKQLNDYTIKSGLLFEKRKAPLPPGYFLEGAYSGANLNYARNISRVLTEHHAAYKRTVSQFESTKPQPSYRTYLELTNNDTLRISISPILLSHAGSINAAGIFMNRITDPDFPINQKRRSESELFTEIGKSIYQELVSYGERPCVLRAGYPY